LFCHPNAFYTTFSTVFFVFLPVEIFTVYIGDFKVCSLRGTVLSENLKILSAISCVSMASTSKVLSEDKVFDLLNDSCVCLIGDRSEKSICDDGGSAHTSEEVPKPQRKCPHLRGSAQTSEEAPTPQRKRPHFR
jgi:hypothetical protein